MARKQWWADGIQFECQGSGKCCVSHGEYGFVFLTLRDRQQMAVALNLNTAKFTKEHCVREDGSWRLRDSETQDCRFLVKKQCSVYKARPTQCRTWPFWPEVMNAKTWSSEVASFCPGVGKGRTWKAEEIEAVIKEQRESESNI